LADGRDHTLFALKDGIIKFDTGKNNRTRVNVEVSAE